jgi:hypothetical protein
VQLHRIVGAPVWYARYTGSAKWQVLWPYVLGRAWSLFLAAEGCSPIEVHSLRSEYGENSIGVSSVRHSVRRIKIGVKDTEDRPRSGRPGTVTTSIFWPPEGCTPKTPFLRTTSW